MTIPVVQSLRILEIVKALELLFDSRKMKPYLDALDIPCDTDTETVIGNNTNISNFEQIPTVRELVKKYKDLRATLMER